MPMTRASSAARRWLYAVAALVVGTPAFADPPPGFQKESVLSGLSLPTSIVFLPDGRMLVAEKTGGIVIADPATLPATPAVYMTITDLDDFHEHGLIDITLDPNFANNGYFYAYYARASNQKYRISRFHHEGVTGDLASETVIWQDTRTFENACCHHGGSINFGPDGKLYLTTGDEFSNYSAQDPANTQGKVLRMNPDGSVPADNPFVDGPGGSDDHVWALGLRNAFRARWDLSTGRFFIGEVGSNDHAIAWEDVHLGAAGANYGWPLCEGFCSDPIYTDPIFSYPHEGAGASITGGIVYRNGYFPAAFEGAYFYGDYVRGWLRYLTFDGFGDVLSSEEFDAGAGAVVDIKQGPDGALYYCDIFTGDVRRYTFAVGVPVAHADRAYVAVGGAVAIPVLANDEGSLDPATVQPVDPPAHGALSINPTTGEITYTHDGSASRTDTFSYTVDDGDGDTSNPAEVTVRIMDGNCTLVGAGLVLQLESDSGLVADGGAVVSWADQSGFGNDLAVAGGAPQVISNGINGQPVVAFDGVDDALGRAMLNGISVGPSDRSVFMVVRYSSTGWGGFEYGDTGANEVFGLDVAPSGDLAVRGNLAPFDFLSPEAGAGAGYLIQSATVHNNALRHYRDGAPIDSRIHGFNTFATRARLGGTIDDAQHVDMDVAAVLVYNRALSANELRTVEDYLHIKYFAGACSNLTPLAFADTAAVAPGGAVTIDVLANDSDPDGALVTGSVQIVEPALHAASLTVDALTGQVTYVHDGSASTDDAFAYTVLDDTGAESNPATVSLIVRDDDCNSNGTPDVNEFSGNCAENDAIDCNFDGVLDECDADCDANHRSDVCDLTFGLVTDCAGTNGFVGDYATGHGLHAAFCQGCHNVGGVGGLGGAPNHRNRSRYEYQRKLSSCQVLIEHFGGTNNLGIDDFAHLERYLSDYAAPDDPRGGDGVPDRCQDLADCDGDGLTDACALAAGLVPDCNTNGRPDACDLAGGGSSDCNNNLVPDECERADYAENFNGYAPGADPVGWFDTGPDNGTNHVESLFHTYSVGGAAAFGTTSTQTNIHSHYVGAGSSGWGDYEFTGRLRISSAGAGIGVTFWSDYPNSDSYYRLRRGNFSGNTGFHIDPHNLTITGGDIASDVTPAANQWYRFRVRITDAGTRTEIRANVWPDGAGEPGGWQIDCWDDSPGRRTSGTIGVATFASGEKYWDDFAVQSVFPEGACNDYDPCTVNDTCSAGVCSGVVADCDGDGACDAEDNCPGVPNADQANADGDAYGDACDAAFDVDHDGDVDAAEIKAAINCLEGPDMLPAPACGAAFDVDHDGDVDLVDFSAGQRAFTGALVSPCD